MALPTPAQVSTCMWQIIFAGSPPEGSEDNATGICHKCSGSSVVSKRRVGVRIAAWWHDDMELSNFALRRAHGARAHFISSFPA